LGKDGIAMKRLSAFLLFAFLASLVVAIPANAVQLQAGWYAEFAYVWLAGEQWEPEYVPWEVEWLPTSPLGQQGHLLIEGVYPSPQSSRKITITESFASEPGVIFEDSGTFDRSKPYYSNLRVSWMTNYDGSTIQLQLYRRRAGYNDELVWRQTASGYALDYGDVWNASPILPGDDVVFKLVVSPEPPGMLVLGAGMLIGLFSQVRARGWRRR
jgi:hypothetical protein